MNKLIKITLILHFAFCILHFIGVPALAVQTPRNPDSAKECALCHYRWIDTFFLDGKGSELVEYQAEMVVAKPEICFTCHDGSVVDSRARVFNDHRHKVDRKPPSHIKIPKIFPLDKAGNMQCSTCHTAHGVSSEMGMEKTIFLRTSNENSDMCRMCHTDKDGGIDKGNHPIGVIKTGLFSRFKIPKGLIARGASVGDKKEQIICETCHTVHGAPDESFLIRSARNSGLCLECHGDKNIFTPEGKRNSFHVINAKSEKIKIPDDLIKKGAKLGYNGMIICQTCHKIHNNNIEKNLLLIKKDEKSTLCLTCHTDKQYLTDTKHNLMHSVPNEKNLEGKTVAEAGVCSACHLPHKTARKLDKNEETDFTTQLCFSCHSTGNIGEKVIPADYKHPVAVSPFKIDDPDVILTVIGVEKEKLTLPLFNKHGAQDRNGMVTCATCHDPHKWRSDSTQGEIRKDIKGDNKTSFLRKPSPDLCKECHSTKFSIIGSKHDITKVAPEEKNYLGQTFSESGLCGVCHIVHGGQKTYLWGREITSKSDLIVMDLCISCHNENGMARKKVIKDYFHPVNISPFRKDLTTTLPLFDIKGKVSKEGFIACQTCHDPHRWDPVKTISGDHYETEGNSQNSFLRLENSPSPKLCNNCHIDKVFIEKTDHDLLITAPDEKNIIGQTPAESGTCGVCHLVHNGQIDFKLWAQPFPASADIMETLCNACHSEKGSAKNKVPLVASHPKNIIINNVGREIKGRTNYFPLFNKSSGELETIGRISCPSCHNVHQWDPRHHRKGKGYNVEGTAANSFLRQQSYSLLCIDCHGLDALFRFKYFHEPSEYSNQ